MPWQPASSLGGAGTGDPAPHQWSVPISASTAPKVQGSESVWAGKHVVVLGRACHLPPVPTGWGWHPLEILEPFQPQWNQRRICWELTVSYQAQGKPPGSKWHCTGWDLLLAPGGGSPCPACPVGKTRVCCCTGAQAMWRCGLLFLYQKSQSAAQGAVLTRQT